MLIASDLHAHSGNPNAAGSPSFLSTDPSFSKSNLHPINGAIDLVKAEGIKVDWVLCPGDLCNQADHTAQLDAWKSLEALKKASSARRLIGTVGNHDLDSHNPAAIATLQAPLKGMSPRFPLTDAASYKSFWQNGYAIYNDKVSMTRLVIVDSCVFHAIADPTVRNSEFRHGRISEQAIAKLAQALNKNGFPKNILMMHHHIRQHPFTPDDISQAHNSMLLLEILRDTGLQWFVLHGHEHVPNLSYGEGGVLSPIILSAGSVAAKTWARRGVTARNQLYLVEINDAPAVAPELRGRLFAWDWTPYLGWSKATEVSGLPWKTGFGCRSVGQLASDVASLLGSMDPPRLKWSKLEEAIPDSAFLVPADRKALVHQLEHAGFEVYYDEFQVPTHLEMPS